jgi:nascent polypeptide-associated complex subunit alpha
MMGGGRGGNRQMRRMMDKMGMDMEEVNNVQEVIIKTDKKEIIINKPTVTEMKTKDSSIFQVVADSIEEKELEVQIFSDEDISLVSQQANVDEETAKNALAEAEGDLARAILLLTTN